MSACPGVAPVLRHQRRQAALVQMAVPSIKIEQFLAEAEGIVRDMMLDGGALLRLDGQADGLTLTVADNGVGIEQADRSKPQSFGLRGMAEAERETLQKQAAQVMAAQAAGAAPVMDPSTLPGVPS